MKVLVKNVRIAFAKLHQPQQINNGPARYSAAVIIEPGSDQAKEIENAIMAVATEKWKDKAKTVLTKLRSEGRIAYKTEPKTNKEGEVYDGFEGMHHINASNRAKPTLLDRDRTPLTEESGKPYSGCYANVLLDFWAQDDKQFGRRVNATLLGVQFVADGPAFAGDRVASTDAFPDLGGQDDAVFA